MSRPFRETPIRLKLHEGPYYGYRLRLVVKPEDKPSRFSRAADWLAANGWRVVVWSFVAFAGAVLAAWVLA